MKRRDVLATTAVFVSAGCLGGGNAGTGGNTGNDSTNGSETETTGIHTTDAETDAGTVEPTTDAETNTTTPTTETIPTTTEPTNTATETTTDEIPDTPIPIPDAPNGTHKGISLVGEARVAFKNNGSRIVVTGTIVGENGCQKPVLDSVRKTKSGLVITIATERDAPANAACTLALVELDYRFTVNVENPPESVTVIHRGATGKQTIVTVKPSG